MAVLEEAWDLLQREHIDRQTLDADQLSAGAIRGMLDALDDPYASYLGRKGLVRKNPRSRAFSRVSAPRVGIRDELLTVIAPLPDTPAEKAGIMAGDVILAVDGESTENLSLQEAVSRIRGQRGTTVQLLVRHANQPDAVLIPITRGVIPWKPSASPC